MPGKSNILADKASRQFHDNTEWILRQDLFLSITQLWGKPDVDLFASRLNAQLPCYVSWKPDPGASKSNEQVMNKTAECIAWLQFFVNCVGDHQPDNGGIYLPTCFSKNDIYKKILEENEALNQLTLCLTSTAFGTSISAMSLFLRYMDCCYDVNNIFLKHRK